MMVSYNPPAFNMCQIIVTVTLIFSAILLFVISVRSPTTAVLKKIRRLTLQASSNFKHSAHKNMKECDCERKGQIEEVNRCPNFLSAMRFGRWVEKSDVDSLERQKVREFLQEVRKNHLFLPLQLQLQNKTCGE